MTQFFELFQHILLKNISNFQKITIYYYYPIQLHQKNQQPSTTNMLKSLNFLSLRFASIKLPIVDLNPFLTNPTSHTAKKQCQNIADALHRYGCVIVKDPRANHVQSDNFLDMMQKYFAKRAAQYYAGRSTPDICPQYNFQVGAIPQFKQRARDHSKTISLYTPENLPQTPTPPPYDSKWRYFWDISTDDRVPKLYPNQVPADFPQFKTVMDRWGRHMINGCYTVAEMAAIGLGLEREVFITMMDGGEHKLAPTGSDLEKFKVGTIFAGYHYDFNFLTIHGKSRYSGLFAWLRTGQKFPVSVPSGHLLLQSGKQFQHITGGYIPCGYHQVIYTQQAHHQKQQALKQGRIPWRVSSTLFSHFRDDVVLKPIGKFETEEARKKYGQMTVREQTVREVSDIYPA